MSNEELIENINYLLEILGTCDYTNVLMAKISQKKVIKAYDKLFAMKKKIEAVDLKMHK